ncbi:MAG: hypothetical protein JWM10_1936 [Myxococcaceae bacterium]|nr:hypothetical protein [Myxococcaceae bacterium]
MRLPFLAALLLAACATNDPPLPAPDGGQDVSTVETGGCAPACGTGYFCQGTRCVGEGDLGALDTGVDATDTGVDAGSQIDSPVAVADAGTDGGTDAPAADAGRCPNGPSAMCDGRYVDLVSGERDGGVVHFCGACNVACAADEVCDACRCAR